MAELPSLNSERLLHCVVNVAFLAIGAFFRMIEIVIVDVLDDNRLLLLHQGQLRLLPFFRVYLNQVQETRFCSHEKVLPVLRHSVLLNVFLNAIFFLNL
jgi:hypothetical protein